MPDYGYGGGNPQDQLSLYSMMLQQPGYGGMLGMGMNPRMIFQQGQQRPRQPMPWWQQMFWNRPDQATNPEKRDDRSRQNQAMQLGQLGLQMLQPRQPTHTGPYPWI